MASQNSFNRDNAPERQQQRTMPRSTIIMWLVAMSSVFLLIPLYFVFTTIRSDAVRLNANIQTIRELLANTEALEPESQAIVDELAQVQQSINQVEEAYSNIATGHVDWSAVMAAIGNYNQAEIMLTSVTQGNSLILEGRAIDDTVVIAYSRSLEETNLFSRVVVQSLRTIATPFAAPTSTAVGTPTPTPTSTTTLSPTTTPTPTPNPYDEYETDDFQPQAIFFGQPQLHNFYPFYDVDKITFLAKAGRYYRIFTSNLMPGVDTFLTVNVGGAIYTGDDRGPGDLSSEIVFQVGTGYDVDAIVRVTNRGQYGPEMWYQIAVDEVLPTPTPTPTPTPVPPTPTSTPILPTATHTPVPPTATPDLRDEYEPDDTAAQPIAMGETQAHNFYPKGDVDKIEFLAKAGRWYRVSTSDLAPGVDTFLTVILDATTYTNDDLNPGELGSEITFQVETGDNVNVLVKVTNLEQYGADKKYQITVEEIIPTPTPTLTPTPTDTPVPVSTSTPDLRDGYEPDDTAPQPIAIGETQVHSFYPDGDVDQIEFLAKAGHWYQVSTSALVLGVDTFLEVSLDGITYTDDDRGPGDLSSEIVFPADAGYDVNILVKVTNRGQYGPDKQYQITVEEVSLDPIAVGETQERSFYKSVEDMLRFEVKAGHWYIVSTSELAVGVDTFIRVTASGEVMGENDDAAPGDFASEVRFQALSNDTAIVMVTNLQKLYGPNKSYQITVQEFTPTSAGSLSPSRFPGLASPIFDRAKPDSFAERTDILISSSGNEETLGIPSSQAVEFVIVLELAQESP